MSAPNLKEGIAGALKAHGWHSDRNDGVGRCYCFTTGDPVVGHATHAAHQADAVLAFLAEQGWAICAPFELLPGRWTWAPLGTVEGKNDFAEHVEGHQ